MYIGVDIGGTTIKAGLVNQDGDIVLRDTVRTGAWRETEKIVDDIAEGINRLKEQSTEPIEFVGVGVPSVVTEHNSYVPKCVNLNLRRINLKQALEERTGLITFVDNDANVAAIAELETGSLKGVDNGLLITLGTGVGGGIIINGEIVRGSHGAGSEIGHMVIGENFYQCNCGRNGCLETYASATAVDKYAAKVLRETDEETVLREAYENKQLSAKKIFEASMDGDWLGREVVDRFAKYLGIGIINFMNLFDPEVIALGGGISNSGEYLIQLLRKEIEQNKMHEDIDSPKIVIADLKNDAGIIGAAFMAKRLVD
jgi:glucokinase